MRYFLVLLFFVFSTHSHSQDSPSLTGDGFITLAGEWDGEYIMQHDNGVFDTSEAEITAEIYPIKNGAAGLFTVLYPDGISKADWDTLRISKDGKEIDMGRIWTLTEIIVDAGDTILMLERKVQTDNNQIHYLRSILRAGPDKFAILTAVRRNPKEDYYLEEQYRFTRK